MKFRDVLKIARNKNELYLGYNHEGNLKVNLSISPSIIITGETGAGKSILLDQILCELISSHTSLELGLMTIDTCGVELNYYNNSNYVLSSATNDLEKIEKIISRILKEIERRKDLLASTGVKTVTEYNKVSDKKLPTLVLAIDDDRRLLTIEDMCSQITSIISSLNGLGIYFIMATNDVYNEFFVKDNNTYSSILISFDLAESEAAKYTNVEDADKLGIGYFLLKKGKETTCYTTYNFDDHIITELIER